MWNVLLAHRLGEANRFQFFLFLFGFSFFFFFFNFFGSSFYLLSLISIVVVAAGDSQNFRLCSISDLLSILSAASSCGIDGEGQELQGYGQPHLQENLRDEGEQARYSIQHILINIVWP